MPPPSVISPLRVVAYACVDATVLYRGNKTLFVDGELLGPVPCMAICHDPKTNEFAVAYCDSEWGLKGIAGGYATPDKAKGAAERTYKGIAAHWKDTQYTEADVAQFLDQTYTDLKCSFCEKRPDQVENIIQGRSANICDECVKLFHKYIEPGTDA